MTIRPKLLNLDHEASLRPRMFENVWAALLPHLLLGKLRLAGLIHVTQSLHLARAASMTSAGP